MRIKFWGAAQTVTGSMHLLELDNGDKILLDCGIYQGAEGFREEYNRSFPCDPAEITFVILSHAHIDHCGNLPQLVKAGFKGKIYCTHATYDLCAIMLQDSAQIQEKDAEYENKHRKKRGEDPIEPIYTRKDVAPALQRFVTLSYDEWYQLGEHVEMQFLDAGHILGSASVSMRITENGKTVRLGFTGDIGRPGRQILRDPQPMPQADYLISESTYGGKDHLSFPDASGHLYEIIQETCVDNKGKLIIPAFSVGRTQDLVHTLDKMEHDGLLPHIPVYVDSPLAVNATRVFEMHPECFDEELMEYIQEDPNPFGFNRLHYVRSVEESKKLNDLKGPAIIISASGMITAGRILHHLKNNIEDPRNTILIVGYCAKGTTGARLIDGEQEVRIFGRYFAVNARIAKLNSMSAHAGQTEMYEFIRRGQDPDQIKNIFLVHGEEDRAAMFKEFLEGKRYENVTIPERGQVFELA